eukprot:12354884-Heterocapsa_arctica.AAC.1
MKFLLVLRLVVLVSCNRRTSGRDVRGDDGEDFTFVRPGTFLAGNRFPCRRPGLVAVFWQDSLLVIVFPTRRLAVRRGSRNGLRGFTSG